MWASSVPQTTNRRARRRAATRDNKQDSHHPLTHPPAPTHPPTFMCASPRSRQMDSTARRAVSRMVPPGVSYTPRDFMPTKRDSTMSTRPMPARQEAQGGVGCVRACWGPGDCGSTPRRQRAPQPLSHPLQLRSTPPLHSTATHPATRPPTVVAAQLVERGEQGCGRHLHAVDGHGVSLHKLHLKVGGRVGGLRYRAVQRRGGQYSQRGGTCHGAVVGGGRVQELELGRSAAKGNTARLCAAASWVPHPLPPPFAKPASQAPPPTSTHEHPPTCSGETERVNMLSLGSTHGSSSALLQPGRQAGGGRQGQQARFWHSDATQLSLPGLNAAAWRVCSTHRASCAGQPCMRPYSSTPPPPPRLTPRMRCAAGWRPWRRAARCACPRAPRCPAPPRTR